MRFSPTKLLHGLLLLTSLLLAACGGGGGSTTPAPTGPFTIGGSINGLTGSGLVLRNNGGDDKTITADGSYTFTTSVANGGSYNVTILTQPTSQLCSVTGGSGTASANVTNANVSCVNAYTIGGNINSSVAGIGPTLQNNLGDNLFTPAINIGNTPFTFSTPVASGGSYSVTQLSRARAPAQNCVVSGGGNGSGGGTVATANISSIVVTCTATPAIPKFAYVTNNTADTVSAYITDSVTGALTAAVGTPIVASGDGPYSVTVEPGGRFVYVANSNADTISAYSINTITGVLTVLTDVDGGNPGNQTSITTGDFPISITVHPSGKFAYTVNQGVGATGNTISAYSINATTGALSAMDADGATTGTQATIATGTLPYAITVDPTGKFAYVANYTSGTISAYTINTTSGALTTVASYAAGGGPSYIAINPAGTCALVANNTTDNIMSYTVNTTTGALGIMSTVLSGTAGSAPRSVAVDPNTGLFAYVANAGGKTVTGATWSGGAATFTTSTAHGYKAGTVVHVSGVDPTGYNGTHTIVSVPTTTTFTVTIANPGAYISGGTIAEGSVSAFSVNLTTCLIASIVTDATGGTQTTISAGTTPFSVNVDPSGLFVYVANFGSDNVSVYNIDGAGALTLVETEPAGSGPTSVTTTQ